MEDFCRRYLDAGDEPARQRRVIDLGSQDLNGSYRHLFDPARWEYIGIDMAEGNNVDITLKDPYHWAEVASECADCVISGQAFEHTEYFWLSMGEIARVMRPGGRWGLLAPAAGAFLGSRASSKNGSNSAVASRLPAVAGVPGLGSCPDLCA